ncbi:helix-turn-helix transcriptional regulator [Sorangium sp. So ce216]
MKRGRPSLEPEQAQRVREALQELLHGRHAGNVSALARDLNLSQSAVSQLISKKNAPSFSTAQAVANAVGVPVLELLHGSPPHGTQLSVKDMVQKLNHGLQTHPNLQSAIRYLDGERRISGESEGTALMLATHLPSDLAVTTWIAIMLDLEHARVVVRAREPGRPEPEAAADAARSPEPRDEPEEGRRNSKS